MSSIVLLFGFFPVEKEEFIKQQNKKFLQYAADALQKGFIEGLSELYDSIEIINVPYINPYPFGCKNIFFPSFDFIFKAKMGKQVLGKSIGFCNIALLRLLDRYRAALTGIKALHKQKRVDVVIVYALHTPFLKAAIRFKRNNPSVKIIVIVPDLPQFMSSKTNKIYKFLKKIDIKNILSLCENIDGYVLLSKYMFEILPTDGKKWDVVEGIYYNSNINFCNDIKKVKGIEEKKVVFYSGTLDERYGIMNLVNAVMLIKNINVELQICGGGDSEQKIIKISQERENIKYLGKLTRDEVICLQREANLLVNPRTPEGEFTKYSFPSKTMEYLASGTPTLLYKLPGIPNEYYDYCFTLEDISIDSLSEKIEEIFLMPQEDLNELGLKARDFILKKKNPLCQCEKIQKLIDNL